MKDYACIFGTKDGVEYGRYVYAPTLSTAFGRAALQFPRGEYESNDFALCECPSDQPSSCKACLRLSASVTVEEKQVWSGKKEFTTDANIAYKFKRGGKWTPLLHYIKSESGLAFFKPVEDTESTLTHSVISLFITSEQDETVKVFRQCKFYSSWEKVSHECGKDCPLGK